MAINDVSVLRAVGRYQQQNCVSSFHYRHTAQVTDELEILNDLITAWANLIETEWLAAHIDTYELIGYKAFRVTGASKVPAYQNRAANGTVTGLEVPSNICRTITMYTASTNHRRRGRVMLSGSEQAMFLESDGSLTTASVALLQSIADYLDSGLTSGSDTFELVLPATDALPVEAVVKSVGRVTPSALKSRRVKQYLIG
ncbi:MAG: hypothetical protein KAT00_05690 [Planctomycetes bacterium]|nr:hypothetical protein [Planctomycetota bacterium]